MNSKKSLILLTFLTLFTYLQCSSMELTKEMAKNVINKLPLDSIKVASTYAATLFTTYALLNVSWAANHPNLTFNTAKKDLHKDLKSILLSTTLVTCAMRLGTWPQLGISDLKTPALGIAAITSIILLDVEIRTIHALRGFPFKTIQKRANQEAIRAINNCIRNLSICALPLYLLIQRYRMS